MKIKDKLRHTSANNTFVVNTMSGIGIVVVSSLVARMIYVRKQCVFYDREFLYVIRGKIIGDVKIDVGSAGTRLNYNTNLHGGTPYEELIQDCTEDKYTLLKKNKVNPMVTYHKKDNMTVIKIGLSKNTDQTSAKANLS